jgi:hypothetical protein
MGIEPELAIAATVGCTELKRETEGTGKILTTFTE